MLVELVLGKLTVSAAAPVCSFHYDHVLGTSLDVWLRGNGPLETAEAVILDGGVVGAVIYIVWVP
jgi:hypothetical protein